MIKVSVITINIILAMTLYLSNTWYQKEDILIEQSNRKYIKNTRKLKEIKKIDKWLSQVVKQNLVQIPKDSKNADLKLIEFFDQYAKEYDFEIDKFIYKDELAHLLEIKYTILRNHYKTLENFMKQEYAGGYLLLKSYEFDKSTLKGTLVLVQPYPSKQQKKEEKIIDDVPQ